MITLKKLNIKTRRSSQISKSKNLNRPKLKNLKKEPIGLVKCYNQERKMNSWFKIYVVEVACLSLLTPALAKAADPQQIKNTGFVSVPEEPEYAPSAPVGTAPAPVASVKESTPKVMASNETQVVSQEEALKKAWQDELAAQKKAEESEYKATQLREEVAKKRYEYEKEIAIKRKKIYDYENKQGQFAEEIEHLKSEIAEMDGRLQEFQKDLGRSEEKAKMHETDFKTTKSELDQTKAQLVSSIDSLKKTRELTASKINKYMIDMQKSRAEVAVTEAEIARAENDKARAEAEELQVRSQWSSLSAKAQALREDKTRILSELADVKTRLDFARKDYQLVKAEYDKAEKEKVAAEQEASKKKIEINAEMRKLESDSAFAYNQRANAEAEKIRLQAEIEKLKAELAYTKKRNADAQVELSDSQGIVMESRLAFETAKADLTKELSAYEVSQLKRDSDAVKVRYLANVADSSEMIDAHKPWVADKSCKVTRSPASNGEVGGKLKIGERLIAAPSASGFVKILNSSGKPAYVPMNCGHFAE